MLRRLLIPGLLALLFTGFVSLLFVSSAGAEACGSDASTCKICHEGDQQMPVNQFGIWHTQHSFGDFCANCHLGDTTASQKEPSHLGMRPVLADAKASCEACHADNYQTLADTYQKEKEEPKAALPPPPQLPPPGSRNGLFVGLNAVVLAGLLALVWAFEKGPLAGKALPKPMAGSAPQPRNPLARVSWSPYWAGAGLGLVAIASLWLAEQPLGSSGAFLALDSLLLKVADAPLAQSVYFKLIMPPKLTWQVMLVAGVVAGAFLSAVWSRDFRLERVPDRWREIFGNQTWKRWATIFLGGMILEFGASIAGGCTSGLAIAGSLQLAGAGFLFIGGLFATGVVTAKLLYGRNY